MGFSDCGIARAEALGLDEYPLAGWLENGFHADMSYMEHHTDMRCDPRLLLPGARSVISLLVAYKPDRQMEGPARIAQYAYGEDYHERLKRMLYQLLDRIKALHSHFEARPFVDTAPISDRHWARRAGLGWIGRNTLLLHPRFGSYCFIGELVTAAAFDRYDTPLTGNPCEDCRRCVEACPNHAIVEPLPASAPASTMIDSRRCTSYNTIENRAETLPPTLNRQGYAFGCDICQSVCPLNQQAPAAFHLDEERKKTLESLAEADEATFHKVARHSALSRIKYPQWIRNCKMNND